ncbi:MAG: class I SAM-dependent methyltransferase [Elusimicrobia bacterium]|nr:class I SAM-dependent methyltransferase [Elusimicrobiota bacterium]
MFPEEASWFNAEISKRLPGEIFPLLNLGSSTGAFRTLQQPHIDSRLFASLREKGREVVHCDIKEADGVDVAGDVTSPEFVEKLKSMGFRSVLCSHLLKHVDNPGKIADAISSIVPSGGYLFISCPYRYPHHPDPFDNMFRPSPEKLAELFPDMKVESSSIISGGRYARPVKSFWVNIRVWIRLAMPFYRPSKWIWHFRDASSSCLVLKKQS